MRHLLSIEDLDRPAIERILDRAKSFTEVSEREIKKVPALRGRRVLNLFWEASTRTRSSFELAAKDQVVHEGVHAEIDTEAESRRRSLALDQGADVGPVPVEAVVHHRRRDRRRVHDQIGSESRRREHRRDPLDIQHRIAIAQHQHHIAIAIVLRGDVGVGVPAVLPHATNRKEGV